MKVDNDFVVKYHCEEISKQFELKDKMILDVGCGNGAMVRYIADEYQPQMIVGIDINVKKDKGELWQTLEGDSRQLEFDDNTFDAVYSISTFEHINGVAETLSEIRRVLKPRGKFYTVFMPLWTSVAGHHCYSWSAAFPKGSKFDRYEKIVFGIPAWGHLYMSETEMGEHLLQEGFEDWQITEIINYIYRSDGLNRRTYSETKNDVMNCGMIVNNYFEFVQFTRNWALDKSGPSELTPDIIKKVEANGYNVKDIGVVGLGTLLEKYVNLP